MKMVDLVNAAPALRKLAGKELQVKTAYKVAMMVKKMDNHLQFHDEKFRGLLEIYCTEDEDGWKPKSVEDNTEFLEKRKELLELDVDMEGFEKVVIPAGEKITLSAADIMAMENFVEISE